MAADAQGLWPRVSEYVAGRLGLHFPPERTSDLRRGLSEAARELALADDEACARQLLEGRFDDAQLRNVASHLTIGETYFWRGSETFEALAGHVLPALARARTGQDRRLRVWSAACCTGEEAYSLAILLRQALPDFEDWHLSILATDLNPRFLRKAAEATYGAWSFRDTPPGFRERYFRRDAQGRFVLAPEIRRMVTCAPLNLAEDVYPSLATGTNAMDLILCRNVLMYFTPEQARRVAANLHRALRPDGWLVVAPCEVSQTLFPQFTPVVHDGAILYRRSPDTSARRTPSTGHAGAADGLASAGPSARTARTAAPPRPAMAKPAHHDAPPPRAAASAAAAEAPPAARCAREAKAAADQGRLSDALEWCDRWTHADKLDADAHYLRAIVLIELGRSDEARTALQRSAFLQPESPMASFALGNLERGLGHVWIAGRHFRNTLEMLDRCAATDELPHSEGITAGQLAVLVHDLLASQPTS
jgi:chemotaxis protein methyltransferase CheR